MAEFKIIVRNARLKKNLSQMRLAELIGVNKQTISQYERGVRFPTKENLNALCDALGVSSDYLLGREQNKVSANFSANLKDIRVSRNLTQKDLAEIINVSDRTVSSWEAGRTEPSLDMVDKLSEALCCSNSDLIGVGHIVCEPSDEKVQLLAVIEGLNRKCIHELLNYARFIAKEECNG